MAGKGHAKGVIKGPDVLSSVVVDTSNAERELNNFITKVNKSSKQLTIDVGIKALKDAKNIWDAMASEMAKVGKSDIFNGLAESFDQADKAFKNIKATVDGKELKGLVNIVKTLTSSDFDKISKIDFGIEGIRNSVLEAKKLEEATKNVVKSEEKLAKTRKQNSRKSDITEKLNKELAGIKRRVDRVANLNLGFRVDTSSIDDISQSTTKLQEWATKLLACREELEKLKKTGTDIATDMFKSIESVIDTSLDSINTKIVETTKLLESAKKNDIDIKKDIDSNVKKLKKQIDIKKDQEKIAKTQLRTQEQINTELDNEIQKLKEIEDQERRNEAAREYFKKKQANYGKEVLGVDHAVYDTDLLKGAAKELNEFNELLETRNKFQEKYIKLCNIIEKYYVNDKPGKYSIGNGVYKNLDDFFAVYPDMERLETLSNYGQKTTNKDINKLFKNVVRSLQIEGSMTSNAISAGEASGALIGQDLEREEIELNREMQRLYDARIVQENKVAALKREQLDLIVEQGKEEAKNSAARIKSSRIKVREFANMDEYSAHQDKYQDEHNGENEYLENVVDIVPRIGKDFNRISADMTTSCKKAETAVKRFFSVLDPEKYPELAEWQGFIEEGMQNGLFSQSDAIGGWSWEVQALDDNTYYVSVIAVTDALLKQKEATEKLAEARLKLTPKKDGSGEYTAMDGKYEIGQDAEGWKVFQRDNAGLWNLIGTYKHFGDIKNDVSLLTREEIVRTAEVVQEIKTLQEAYQSLRTEMGGYMPLANKYIEVLDKVKNGAMSAADAIGLLNEVAGAKGLSTPINDTALMTKQIEDAYDEIDRKVDSLREQLSAAEQEQEKLEKHAKFYGYTLDMSARQAGRIQQVLAKDNRANYVENMLKNGNMPIITESGDYGFDRPDLGEGVYNPTTKTEYEYALYLLESVAELNVGWEDGLKVLASQNGQLDAARQKVSALADELSKTEKEREVAYERMVYAHHGIFGDDNIAAKKQQLNSTKSIVQLTDNYAHALDEVNNKLMQGTKLLNEQGQILRLFHNSPNIFDTFDAAKGKPNQGQALGQGNYLALGQNGEFNELAYGRYQTQWYANVQNIFKNTDKLSSDQAASIIDKFLGDRAEGFKQHMLSKLLDGDVIEAIKDIAHESKTVVGEVFGHIGYDAIMDGAQINVFDSSKIHRANDSVLDIGAAEFEEFREIQKKIWEERKIIENAKTQIKKLTNQYSGQTEDELEFALSIEALSKGFGWTGNVAKIASAFKELTGNLPKSDDIPETSMQKLVENYEFSRQSIDEYRDAVEDHEAALNRLLPQLEAQKSIVKKITDFYLSGDIGGVVDKNHEILTDTIFGALKQIRELENQLRDVSYSDISSSEKMEKHREINAAISNISYRQFPYISKAIMDEDFNPEGVDVGFATTDATLREMTESIVVYATTAKEELGELKLIKIDTSGVELLNGELKDIVDNSGNAVNAYRGLVEEAKSNSLLTTGHHTGATWFSTQQDVASGYTRDSGNLYHANLRARRLFEIDANRSSWNDITFLGDGTDEVSKKITELYNKKRELKEEATRLAVANQTESQSYKDISSALSRVTADYKYYSNNMRNPYGTHDTNWYAKYAKKNGYDAVRIKNVYDTLQGGGLSDVIGVFSEEQILNVEKIASANKKLTSSYEGLAEAVEKYVASSKKVIEAYNKGEDFSQFAIERNKAVEKIASMFPDNSTTGMSASLMRDGYSMMLQDFNMSQMFAKQGVESTLQSIEKNLTQAKEEQARLAQKAEAAALAQAEAEQKIAEEANKAADAEERRANATNKLKTKKGKKSALLDDDESKERIDIIQKAVDDAIEQLRDAENNINEKLKIDLSQIESPDDLNNQIGNLVTAALGTDLSIGVIDINKDIAAISLYNEELGVTTQQIWQLEQAAEGADKAQLKFISADRLRVNLKQAQKYAEAQKKALNDSEKHLLALQSRLNTQSRSYQHGSKKLKGDSALLLPDATTLKDNVDKTLDSLVQHIQSRIDDAKGKILTDAQKNAFTQDLVALENEIKIQQADRYKSGTMSPTEVTELRKILTATLDTIASKAKKNNVFDDISESYNKLKANLNDPASEGYFKDDKISDAVQKIRTLQAETTKAVAEEGNLKSVLALQEKLYNSKRKLAELNLKGQFDTSEALKAKRLTDELQAQYDASVKLISNQEQLTQLEQHRAALQQELTAAINEQQQKINQQHYTSNQYLGELVPYDYTNNGSGGGGGNGPSGPGGGGPNDPNRIKEQYQSILNLINEINEKNTKISSYQKKDAGSGVLSGYITPLQQERETLINELNGVKTDVNNTLGDFFLQGQQNIKLPLATSIGTDIKVIEEFLNSARVQAVLTKDEINALISALSKAQGIDVDFLGDEIAENKERIKQIQKENAYFNDKTSVSLDADGNTKTRIEDIQKLGTESTTAKEKLEEMAQAIAKNSEGAVALTKNFSMGADGIARLDFSVFNTNTGEIKDFTAALGTATGQMGVFETTVDKLQKSKLTALKQIETAQSTIGRLGFGSVGLEDSSAPKQIADIVAKIGQLREAMKTGDQNLITQYTKDLQEMVKGVEKADSQMRKMQSAIESGQAIGLGTIDPKGDIYGQLAAKAQQFAATQGAATLEMGNFDQATNTLNASLVYANGAVEQVRVSMYGLGGQCAAQQSGVEKLTTTWDRFKVSIGQVGRQLLTAFVGYNVFYKAISEVRKGVNYVKEIDLALTELKKVTDETESSYAKFLNTAASTAGEIGSTVSDFTEATANFARLGYTIKESAEMAKTAIVYKNVADGLDTVGEATDSIISTMKAFGIESNDTMGIIDRFNEVGNNFAITSAGIGEALQRSASALYAGGNTIDEAIALVTAANSVIQNPEQVGEEIAQQYSNILLENSYIG